METYFKVNKEKKLGRNLNQAGIVQVKYRLWKYWEKKKKYEVQYNPYYLI